MALAAGFYTPEHFSEQQYRRIQILTIRQAPRRSLDQQTPLVQAGTEMGARERGSDDVS